MALRFPNRECIDIYFACGDIEGDCNLVKQLLPRLERSGFTCFCRLRDGEVQLRIETARGVIPTCSLVLAFASKGSIAEDCKYLQYEIALAMDFRRKILIVELDDVKIPSLFRKLDSLPGRMDQPLEDWVGKLLKGIKQRIRGNPKPCYEIDLVKEFLWNIEGKEKCEEMGALSRTVNNFIAEIAHLKKRNNDLIHIRMQECDDLETANQRLEAQLEEMQAKLSDRNVCPYSYAAEVAAQCVKHQQEKDQLKAEIKCLKRAVKRNNDSSSEDTVDRSDRRMVDNLYRVLTLDVNPRTRSGTNTGTSASGIRRVPSEVAAFFHRYQGLIGYDEIPALGRELGLTCSQLDEVDRYRTSGLSQMFWQICREYSIGQSETCSVTQMVGALAKIGINIEGRPMNTEQRILLEGNLDYIYKHMKDVIILLPALLEKTTLNTAQASYIEAPRSCRQRVERLIEVLVTKDTGFDDFCEALDLSGQTCLADHLRNLESKIEARTHEKIPFEHEDKTRLAGSSDETSLKRSDQST